MQNDSNFVKIPSRMAASLVRSGWRGASILPVARRSQPGVQRLSENQCLWNIRLVWFLALSLPSPWSAQNIYIVQVSYFNLGGCFWFAVSQTDMLRLDLNLPGELHYYLRASTSQERQQWLVALGSAKACEGITKEASEPGITAAKQTIHANTFWTIQTQVQSKETKIYWRLKDLNCAFIVIY